MKRFLLLPLVVAVLISCGGGTSKYEKMIADVVQTDGKGTKYDLNFKVEKMEEINRITVADSIRIITEQFNADKDKKLEQLQTHLNRNKDNLEKESSSRHPSKSMITAYQNYIDHYSHLIDSLNQTTPTQIASYENRGNNDDLAVVIRCTYSIDEPLTKKRATETFDFVLSPDATKYYSKKRVRE